MNGHSIVTRSGLLVDLLAPEPASIRLTDIALAQSRIPRFNGHTSRFWSCADHSLLVLQLVGDDAPPALRLAALLHDGHEAYVGDMTTPMEIALGTTVDGAYAAVISLKYRLDRAIAMAFGISPDLFTHSAIKAADRLALAIEARQLMDTTTTEWALPALPDPMPMLPATDQMRAQNHFLLAALDLLKQTRGARQLPAEAGAEAADV